MGRTNKTSDFVKAREELCNMNPHYTEITGNFEKERQETLGRSDTGAIGNQPESLSTKLRLDVENEFHKSIANLIKELETNQFYTSSDDLITEAWQCLNSRNIVASNIPNPKLLGPSFNQHLMNQLTANPDDSQIAEMRDPSQRFDHIDRSFSHKFVNALPPIEKPCTNLTYQTGAKVAGPKFKGKWWLPADDWSKQIRHTDTLISEVNKNKVPLGVYLKDYNLHNYDSLTKDNFDDKTRQEFAAREKKSKEVKNLMGQKHIAEAY
jgi:hypothetical protein